MSDQTHDSPDPGSPEPDPPGTQHDHAQDHAERTERAFIDIVAHFADAPAASTWPAQEDIPPPPRPAPVVPVVPVVVVRPVRPPRPADHDAPTETDLPVVDAGARDEPDGPPDDDSDEGHYVPPPAPPVPPMRPATRAAVASIVFGIGLLVGPDLAGRGSPVGLDALAVLFVLGGVGALVARMREHRFDTGANETWDDGAEV